VISLITSHTTRQSLQNASRVSVPFCRLECHKSSFFPDCAALWNSLDPNVTASITLSSFKSKMSCFMSQRVDPTCFFLNACYGRMGCIITQFRLGLSPLRADLFTYRIIENIFCQECKESAETLSHFLLQCPKYCAPRQTMLQALLTMVDRFSTEENVSDIDFVDTLIQIITLGMPPPLPSPVRSSLNKQIFKGISAYLYSTGRFESTPV